MRRHSRLLRVPIGKEWDVADIFHSAPEVMSCRFSVSFLHRHGQHRWVIPPGCINETMLMPRLYRDWKTACLTTRKQPEWQEMTSGDWTQETIRTVEIRIVVHLDMVNTCHDD
jgi:hypothetical protein